MISGISRQLSLSTSDVRLRNFDPDTIHYPDQTDTLYTRGCVCQPLISRSSFSSDDATACITNVWNRWMSLMLYHFNLLHPVDIQPYLVVVCLGQSAPQLPSYLVHPI